MGREDVGQDFWSWLPQVLSRRDAHGLSRFSREEAEDFLAVITFAFDVEPNEAPPVLRRSVDAFLSRVDAFAPLEDGPDADFTSRVEAYLRARPLPAELTFELRRGLQEGVVGLSLDTASGDFLQFLGKEAEAPPEGTDRSQRRGSGALAYFKAKTSRLSEK